MSKQNSSWDTDKIYYEISEAINGYAFDIFSQS